MACRCSFLFSHFQLIEDRFGDGGIHGRIDVNALMVSLGLQLPESEVGKHETAYEELARQASRLPVYTHPNRDLAPASAPVEGSDDQKGLFRSGYNSAYSDPRSKAPTSDAFVGETPSGRDGQHGRELSGTGADQAGETDDGDRTSRQRSAGGEPGGIEEGYARLDQGTADPEDALDPAIDFDHATAGGEAVVRECGGSKGADPSGEPPKTTLEQENARFVWNISLD